MGASGEPFPLRRDFAGYGIRLPDVRWPGEARVAVSIVVNFEEGAEFTVSEGDPHNETVYEVVDRQTGEDPGIESHFEYGTRVGWWRIAEIAATHGAPLTLSACGRAVERSPWLARDAARRGHEVAAHGYRWETHAGMPIDVERRNIAATVAAIREAVGRAPVGWHTRSVRTANTRRLLVEQIVDAEVTLQLQVCPVIQRIAQAARHGRRPGEELLIGRRVAGAEALGHAVGAHGAPLVVIALEPDLEEVVEAPVAGHVGRRQVAVVVENRLPRRMLVIEPARRGAVEQEVVGDETHGER